jgi:polar amino acid transport system substrate-binding protein
MFYTADRGPADGLGKGGSVRSDCTRRDVLKRGSLAGVGLVLGPGALAACGDDSSDGGGSLEQIRKDGRITMGFFNEPPASFIPEPGVLSGIAIDLMREVFKPEKVKVDGIIAEWEGLIPGLQAGRWQVIGASMAIVAERCEAIVFASPEKGSLDAFVIDKANPKVADIRSYADVAASPDVKIGVAKGSAQELYVDAAKIPENQIVSIAGDPQTIYAGLQAGRYDIVPGYDASTPWTLKNTIRDPNLVVVDLDERPKNPDGTTADVVYSAAAFRKDDSDLVSFYNKRLAKLRESGKHREILERYEISADALPPKGLTGEEICGQLSS